MTDRASANPIRVRVLLFARFAEVVGEESRDVVLAAPATVADVLTELRAVLPKARELPARPMYARNHAHALPEDAVADGDEIALLPPLAGG